MAKSTQTPDLLFTTDLRRTLKQIVHKELAALPDTLAGLDPVQRLNIVCKLIGYVLPKVEAVTYKQGEPYSIDFSTHD